MYHIRKAGEFLKPNYRKLGELINRIKEKDSQAFTQLYEQTYQKIYFLSLSILKNEADAQDATQETYIKILNNIDNLKDVTMFTAWSNRIAYNVCMRIIENRRDIATEDEELAMIADTCLEVNPLYMATKNEKKQMFAKLIDNMEPVLRATVVMKYYQGLKISEISTAMACPEGTVKSRLNTAKKQLLKAITKEGSDGFFYGAFAILPLRSVLLDSAKNIALSPETAFSTLTQALHKGAMCTKVNFTPTKSAASFANVNVSPAIALSTLSVSVLAAASCATLALSIAPTYANIMVPQEYMAAPISFSAQVKSIMPLSEVYALSPTGEKSTGKQQENDRYIFTAVQNGTYQLCAVSKNGEESIEKVDINNIDDKIPSVISYANDETSITVKLSDDKSGIDFKSIVGKYADGTVILPTSIDEATGTVVFAMPKENCEFIVTDKVGNQLTSDIKIIKE